MDETAAEIVLGAHSLETESAASTYRRIWELGWPVSISTSTITLLTLANLFWISHLGTVAVAAVSLCGNILFIVFGISNVVYTGALAIGARRVGEGDLGAAFSAALHGVCLGGLLGAVVALLGHASAPAIVRFFGAGPEVEATAIAYLRLMFIGQIFLYVTLALSASYQAAGDTRTPMLVNVFVVLVNGVLDPFFIFEPGQIAFGGVSLGWLGWGVDGAAIAAVLSGAAGLLLFLVVSALRGRPFRRPRQQRLRLVPAEFWRMLRIGTPASVSMVAQAAVDLSAAEGDRVVRYRGDRGVRDRAAVVFGELDRVFGHQRRRIRPGRTKSGGAAHSRCRAGCSARIGAQHGAGRAVLCHLLRVLARDHPGIRS